MAEAEQIKGPEVLLVGDSLIEYMQMFDFWKELFVPLDCLNLGVGGERSEEVLERLKYGQLENITPKVIVLLCGTNNIDQTAHEVCDGIVEIVKVICEKQPQAQLIVVGIPPKGQLPNKYRPWAVEINAQLEQKVAEIPKCQLFPMDQSLFVNADGAIDASDMFDYLHFTSLGYMKWVPKLHDEINRLLNYNRK